MASMDAAGSKLLMGGCTLFVSRLLDSIRLVGHIKFYAVVVWRKTRAELILFLPGHDLVSAPGHIKRGGEF